jgi:crotonobetainyl-CoA:carnitine CoA-transferase CaiB-like acyl-CoA transferase
MRREGALQDLDAPEYEYIRALRGDSNYDMSPEGLHCIEAVSEFVKSMDAETVYREGQRLGLTWSRVVQPEETLNEEQYYDRSYFRPTRWPGSTEDETYLVPTLPWIVSENETPSGDQGVAEPPEMGQHTDAVLREWLR